MGLPLAEGKSGRTFYTEQKLAILAENVKRYDWARKERDAIVARADRWLKLGDEKLRRLVPPPEVPRDAIVHLSGCPVHGDAVNKVGRYDWIISPEEPYKIKCPVGGEVYPANDFMAFLASGMKDRSLLTGPYADDGRGWTKPGEPKKYWFVAFYAHWAARKFVLRAIDDLSLAYLLTSESKYAHSCAVLLWQLAEYYPRYNYETQSRYGEEFDHGYRGRLLYHTWECFTVQEVVPAYDAIWPAIENDPALEALIGQPAQQIRLHIESRMLRQMATDIMDGSHRIAGNYGMHQVGLLRIAVVLDDNVNHPTRDEMIAWVLNNDRSTLYTDQGLYNALSNIVHRDGYPFESPSYNVGWLNNLVDVADALEEANVRIYQIPRFRKLLYWPLKTACAGEFTPPLGDSNNMFAGVLGWTSQICVPAFLRYGDSAFAKALVQTGAVSAHDLFKKPVDDEITRAAEGHVQPVGVTSALLPAVGFASLQTGNDANRIAASVFYGYYVGHSHFDRLHMDLFAYRNSLIPDFGYPETADTYDPRRFGFFSHTVTHNTVMIDARRQESSPGRLHIFAPGAFAQTVEVSAESAYPGVAKLYRRTLMLVDVAPDKAYVVDIFRARGGKQHDWIVHGTEADFQTDLPLSTPEKRGTLAGPEVPYGCFYDDLALRDKPWGTVQYHLYKGSGFQFLFNVQKAKLDGLGRMSWLLNRPEDLYPKHPTQGVVLRAHLLGRDEEVFACDGRPQLRQNFPEKVKFVIRRRVGGELGSVFVTVFEPYKDKPFIDSVRLLDVKPSDGLPVALEVRSGNLRHVVFNRIETPTENEYAVSLPEGVLVTDGRAAVLEQIDGGEVKQAYLLSGRKAQWGKFTLEGAPASRAKVTGVDYKAGMITLDMPIFSENPPAGSVAMVQNGEHAAAIPVARVVSPTSFCVGDDDLCAARFAVRSVAGDTVKLSPAFAYFARPGMTVINEAGKALGRLKSVSSDTLTLDRAGLSMEDAPDSNQDGHRHLFATVVGPGDELNVHWSTRRRE